MTPLRETATAVCAFTSAALWEGVEEEVEKKRHVRDPFRDAFVALVATPFDAVCGRETSSRRRTRTRGAEDDEDVAMDGDEAEGDARGVEKDCRMLQQDISARSQQVHVRLEILRRQVQCLVAESGADLDTAGDVGVKREASTRHKAARREPSPQDPADEEDAITDLETLLERAALYESGELAEEDLLKCWQRCKCGKSTHTVAGANERLQQLRDAINEEFQVHRERELAYFGPNIPLHSTDVADQSQESSGNEAQEEMKRFLEDCKRSIKPFFLEDFIQTDADNIQESEASPASPGCEESQPEITVSRVASSPVHEVNTPDNVCAQSQSRLGCVVDVAMSDSDSDSDGEPNAPRQNRAMTETLAEPPINCEAGSDAQLLPDSRSVSSSAIEQLRERRDKLRAEALRIECDRQRSHKLQPRLSRVSASSRTTGRQSTTRKSSSLLSEFKNWSDFSGSIIDSHSNLLELRESLAQRDDVSHPVSVPTGAVSTKHHEPKSALVAVCTNSTPVRDEKSERRQQEHPPLACKRQSHEQDSSRSKKQRIDAPVQPARPQTLGAMIQSIHQAFSHISVKSCVSYLSTLIRSSVVHASPQRAFVALVFAASLSNSATDPHDAPTDKQRVRVELQSTRGARDVKLICHRDES